MTDSAISTSVDRDEVEQVKVPKRLSAKDGMPKYKAHKIVEALKIDEARITVSGTLLIPANRDYDPFLVDRSWSAKHMPGGGGYFVRYKDGYESFSPADAFDDGYTILEDGLEEDSSQDDVIVKLKADLLTAKTDNEEVSKSLRSVTGKYEDVTNKYSDVTEKHEEATRANLELNETIAKLQEELAEVRGQREEVKSEAPKTKSKTTTTKNK